MLGNINTERRRPSTNANCPLGVILDKGAVK